MDWNCHGVIQGAGSPRITLQRKTLCSLYPMQTVVLRPSKNLARDSEWRNFQLPDSTAQLLAATPFYIVPFHVAIVRKVTSALKAEWLSYSWMCLRETSSGTLVIFKECPGRISNSIFYEYLSSGVSCCECVCVCVDLCVYARMYLCMYVCMYVYAHVYVSIYACVCLLYL